MRRWRVVERGCDGSWGWDFWEVREVTEGRLGWEEREESEWRWVVERDWRVSESSFEWHARGHGRSPITSSNTVLREGGEWDL